MNRPTDRPSDDEFWPDTQRITPREKVAPRVGAHDHPLPPPTQIVQDRDAYLGQGRNDVGRRISDDQVELFVTGDVAQALQREFAQHQPEFIALHDVGMSASLRLLSSLAGAAGARVQRLSVRRQGHGVALAVIQFVEVPLSDHNVVRVYSTDVNAEGNSRAQMARALLAHSRLGVLMVGELPERALTMQLAPLHDAVKQGPWPNRDLLLVPLGGGVALAAQAAQLGQGTPVAVHVTPHAAKPKHVWTFIGGAWNRLHTAPGGAHALPTELSRAVPKPMVPPTEATTEPMPLQSIKAPGPQAMPIPGATPWQSYVDRCALIKGTLAACVFDMHSMHVLAHAGGPPGGERLAQQGAALMSTMNDASRALGLGPAQAEAAITTSNHHMLLRPVPGHPGVALHLVLHASASNLVLAKMQLERLTPPA
jgi:hypothetical protein